MLCLMGMKRGFHQRVTFGVDHLGLSPGDAETLAKLSTPEKIQDFISALEINREKQGDTCLSVVRTLEQGHAHCIEGAFVAAASLWMAGRPPLLMDMQAEGDADHVVTLFRAHGCWGAISKSNHVWLRWRDPVYRTLRELAMSYFHEYSNRNRRTLRSYSASFDLRRFSPTEWVTNEGDCWDVGAALDDARHYSLLRPGQARSLKALDRMEQKADRLVEYQA